ncbi:MAG TPA: HAD family phosphatase [Peptococcaceae bacterium]|nr:HAD family phosphatase [Peptococcaceae bacterium]
MPIKIAVFDIDGTLAETDEPILPSVAEKLRDFESRLERLVLISGRTASYLAGLARGLGLQKPLVAGENGGVIFDPTDFWEKILDFIPPEIIRSMQGKLLRAFGSLWFQPNQTMLTAAPKDLKRIDELYETVLNLTEVADNGFKLNKYNDSVEVMPKENSKGRALAVIKDLLNIKRDEVIVFGNTVVDLPMKAEADEFLIIGDAVQGRGIKNFPRIQDAFNYLDKLLES